MKNYNDVKKLQRVIKHSALTPTVEATIKTVKEPGVKELLEEASVV